MASLLSVQHNIMSGETSETCMRSICLPTLPFDLCDMNLTLSSLMPHSSQPASPFPVSITLLTTNPSQPFLRQ